MDKDLFIAVLLEVARYRIRDKRSLLAVPVSRYGDIVMTRGIDALQFARDYAERRRDDYLMGTVLNRGLKLDMTLRLRIRFLRRTRYKNGNIGSRRDKTLNDAVYKALNFGALHRLAGIGIEARRSYNRCALLGEFVVFIEEAHY